MATPKRPQLQRGVYLIGGYMLKIKWTFIHNGSSKWSVGDLRRKWASTDKHAYKKKDEDTISNSAYDQTKFIVPIELVKNTEEQRT